MKIILCYSHEETSNAFTSSTIDSFQKSPIENENVEILRVNFEKINVVKMIKNKYPEEKVVLYFFIGNKFWDHTVFTKNVIAKIKQELPEITIIEYGFALVYRPLRVPGNKEKTTVYKLAEKIRSDVNSNFEMLKAYKITYFENGIQEVEITHYEFEESLGQQIYFLTKEEAIEKYELIAELNAKVYNEKIAELNEQIKKYENELKNVKIKKMKTFAELLANEM